MNRTRAKIDKYVYFVGCSTMLEVKKRYKELALKHHPDRGGRVEEFQALANELSFIEENAVSYPIANEQQNNSYDFESAMKQYYYNNHKQARNYEEEIKKARDIGRKQHWERVKKADPTNFSIIDNALADSFAANRTANWLLMEVYKIEGLGLMHFQYIYYRLQQHVTHSKLKSDLISSWYKNYVQIWQIKWMDND